MQKYNDIYFSSRKRLKEAGIEAYALEARLINAAAAEKTPEQFLRDVNLYVAEGFEEKVEELINRRLLGEPVAYLTGEWQFYSLPISVSEDVLIPRVDTELLADTAIKILRGREEPTRVLDLCSGSGCIGIAITANVPDCKAVLVDSSLAALRISRQNVLRNNQVRSITCVDADAMKTPPMLLGKFDMIVSNPPYIPTVDIIGLDPSVRDYEPVWALDGGDDGLDFYRAITEKWKIVLRPRGALMFECGMGQAAAVADIMRRNGFSGVNVFKDTLGIDRVVAGVLTNIDE